MSQMNRMYGYGGDGNSSGEDKVLVWMFAIIVLLIIGIIVVGVRTTREEKRLDKLPMLVYTMPKGTVTRINKCYSGKRYYNCKVSFSDGSAFVTDITEWPDELLTPGNVLNWEIRTQGYRQIQYLCDNSRCKKMRRTEKGDEDYSEVFARGN